jgi:hypothetical protein
LEDQDLGSSSDAQDISMVPKFLKLLSGERYHINMFDENGKLLYPNNPSIPSFSKKLGSMDRSFKLHFPHTYT